MSKHLSQKTIGILLLLSIIAGVFQWILLTEITMKNEYVPKKMTANELTNLYYHNYHPKFDYLNGLWLMPGGLLFFIIISILELPLKFEIIKQELKRDYYRKKYLKKTKD